MRNDHEKVSYYHHNDGIVEIITNFVNFELSSCSMKSAKKITKFYSDSLFAA